MMLVSSCAVVTSGVVVGAVVVAGQSSMSLSSVVMGWEIAVLNVVQEIRDGHQRQ